MMLLCLLVVNIFNLKHMSVFNFFKLYKPREYGYRPIYYDPKKEAMKERMKQAEVEKNTVDAAADSDYKPSIKRGTFREMAQQNKRTRMNEMRKSNIRLVLILAFLLLIVYFLLR